MQGLGSVIRSGIRGEGLGFLMKGWMPAWLRLTYVTGLFFYLGIIANMNFFRPTTVLTFVFMEQLRRLTTIRVFAPAVETARL